MKPIRVYHVDAFTTERFGGNPAGVVLDGAHLNEQQMQQIANELNLSETVFLLPAEDAQADYRVRYFTPTDEVDFCGHATVGIAWILATEPGVAQLDNGVALQTNIGIIPVRWIKHDGQVTQVEMTQAAPSIRQPEIDVQRLSRGIGIPIQQLDTTHPIQLGYTGNWHLLVPVTDRISIDEAKPDLSDLAQYNRELGVITTHLFTSKAENYSQIYTRDFAPAIGIAEDPVTGSANGALMAYLYLNQLIDQQHTVSIEIRQGDTICRGGTLYATVEPNGSSAVIRIAGSAVVSLRGMMEL
ncbi:PhzF family phenazine biosynthesis protein [Paenibacillus sp. WLX1005]|uniref:PhzF family phenazine biosynthesis protein n=1 Tax=Paenibacillus sp. WLX1005 TaxID=3243766 RepID=UPI003983E58C